MTKVYRATIEVLTPVHIGIFEFETFSFFEKDGYLYLVDWDKIFKDSLLFEELKKVLDKNFENEEKWFSYFEDEFIKKNKDNILKKDLTQLRIKINKNVNKDINSLRRNLRFNIRYFNFEKERYLPYIPGSSLKGVLAKVFSFNRYQTENILVSDFYLEDEDKDLTEIFFIQRYYINNSFLKKRSISNLIEMFVPGTRLVGEIKIIKDINFFINNSLSQEVRNKFNNLLRNGDMRISLGFGIGVSNAKTKYLVEYNGEKLPLGLAVLSLKEKNG